MRYILEGVSYRTLMLMMADAPRYVRRKVSGNKNNSRSAEDEANDIVGFYQSNLRQ